MSMDIGDISFPGLNIYLHNVPKSFSVFGFTIALYGVVIAIGIMCGVLIASHDRKTRGLDGDAIWDAAIVGIPCGIIGARIYYVIFAWDFYKSAPLQIFNLRQGGLAIYGGVIGAILSLYIYCRIKKVDFPELWDSVALGFLVGQAIGRWGNFFNREVFGGYTDNILAMRLPIEAVRARDITPALEATIGAGENFIQVHPTFLYESMWNLVLLALLYAYRKHKKFSGEIMCLYLAGYGIGRVWIESIRTDQLYVTGTHIPVSIVVALIMIVLSLGTVLFMRIKVTRKAAVQNQGGSEQLHKKSE
ncbi:MAG: prolipoprotein diacylglyceryl transferase [Lachnospiraceae bacterium]|nr:prolipoprotein diacylglyceryl transferase [Lachnospiraceae bacterium]